MLIAQEIERELMRIATPKKAKASGWFFKTGEGQYGHGDIFCGVTVPEQRLLAKRYKDLPLQENSKLLRHPVHECRLTALIILVEQFKKNTAARKAIYNFYIKNIKHVNNWDLVDASAPHIVGSYLIDKPRDVLYKLARSKNLWHRRIAIVATYSFIRVGDFEETLKISENLLDDKQDLIHKAVGWMLREVGKRSKSTEEGFLKVHARNMPRTALRYAIEKFPDELRKEYLSRKV